MIAKLRHIERIVNPYGGILFCMDEIRKTGIPKLIDKHLGKRVKQAKYSYSDTILAWFYTTLCGSERLEDTKQLQTYFKDIPQNKLPSADIIAGVFKKMATETIKDTIHEFNINTPLNSLLIEVSLKLKLLNTNTDYVMDYDNVIIPCEKYDSKYSYKKCDGYSPGVAFIGKQPIYIEGRNGNTPAKHKMAETIERILELTKKKGIKIKTFRSDAAAYSNSIIKVLVKNKMQFFIRANHNENMFSEAIQENNWKKVEMHGSEEEITSMDYRQADGNSYRVVITRRKADNKDFKNKYTNDNCIYRAIITNNYVMSDEEVVRFYDKRGAMETNFTQLLNDWNWKRLPFSFMNQNVVFMIIGAIGNLLYQHLIRKFSKRVPFVKESYRLKNFIFHFITVALEWVIEENEKVPIIYTEGRDYAMLV